MTTIRVDDAFVDETNATANFTVWLDVADANPVTVNYRTDLNTATYGGNQDFVFTSGTLTFNPGEDVYKRQHHHDRCCRRRDGNREAGRDQSRGNYQDLY